MHTFRGGTEKKNSKQAHFPTKASKYGGICTRDRSKTNKPKEFHRNQGSDNGENGTKGLCNPSITGRKQQ